MTLVDTERYANLDVAGNAVDPDPNGRYNGNGTKHKRNLAGWGKFKKPITCGCGTRLGWRQSVVTHQKRGCQYAAAIVMPTRKGSSVTAVPKKVKQQPTAREVVVAEIDRLQRVLAAIDTLGGYIADKKVGR